MGAMGYPLGSYESRYGKPVFRFTAEASLEDRMFGGIPYECCVFEIDHPSRFMVVSRYGEEDSWIANHGERAVIAKLLDEIKIRDGKKSQGDYDGNKEEEGLTCKPKVELGRE